MHKSKLLYNTVRICKNANNKWHDFTLQKNHLFGEDEQGYFVSSLERVKGKGYIYVYRCNAGENGYHWYKTMISVRTELAKKLFAKYNGKIEFVSVKKERGYAPKRKTIKPYFPYKPLRIPYAGISE